MRTAGPLEAAPPAEVCSLPEGRGRTRRPLRGPALALAGLVVVAAVVYGAVAQAVEMPIVNPDELRYTLAAQGVVDGGGMSLRGHSYGYGPVFPLVLAPILWGAGSVEAAYALFKVANAVLFALAAVPAYFLARRLLPPWWSVGVALASIAIPSSIYTSLVMTESTAYLTATVALLAMVAAVERPSVARQLAMLGALGLAYATRPQFAALFAAFLGAWLLLWAVDRERVPLLRAAAGLWPTLGAIGLVLMTVVGARLLGAPSSAEDGVGGYTDLLRGYDLREVAEFVLYQLAGWEVYLFVVPLVVAPIVVAQMLGNARRGSRRDGAFVAVFLAVNAVLLLIVAAFASSPYGYGALHDRVFFYVAPLWLTAFAVWLSRGLPRPLPWTVVGVVLALVVPAVTPFGLIGANVVFESVPAALWTWVWNVVEGTPHVDGRRVLGLVVVALTVLTVALPRRLWPVLPVVVLAGLLFGSALAWDREVDVPPDFTAAARGDRTWVDDALPDGVHVTKLYVSPPSCPFGELTRQALFLAEFFNETVDRVAHIGPTIGDGLPDDRVDVRPGGRLVSRAGRPLLATYVLAPPEIRLRGTRLAQGTGADLVLWRTEGAVTLASGAGPDPAPASCG